MGISYTSQENARDNLNRENPGWDFAAVRKNAVALWNGELESNLPASDRCSGEERSDDKDSEDTEAAVDSCADTRYLTDRRAA